MNDLSFRVIPNENDSWEFISKSGSSAEDIKINYKELTTGGSLNLYYELANESEWTFSENGSYFSDAKDNFSYQLNSLVANEGKSLIITISSILPHQALSQELNKLLAENPKKVVSGQLDQRTNYEINFRLIAKKSTDVNSLMRYFSQDPRVIIEDMEPH
ncbi:hypothetical protein FHG08_01955 [Pseudoalteromonas sp. Scap03]|jgi:hypothetical protein|uniref:hypothetical protein n=1 Tax=unclassified Pseudoalteromonas TaxID=194690 RepID=UPI00110A7DC4|nr:MULTISPECIES: hypothetical protein [unclassified Pseudoalteromonas]MDN3484588.1 hypothetical protein [Pseudoalteromonas sp. APC 3224]NWL14551.1 hypothetical protein [Pseudoalteromonas sp. Scap03]QLE82559.1 hypothetical protein FLM54_13895 [Pseudoalteromonas sp. Scap25]QLE90501.1 hypothetical protein FLM47_13905 [Pseudoalteromonas sp. Scap06]TMP73262.1 hypothetical protein CWB76_00805 [Pseudoalteromonas sp. S1609]